MPDLGIDQTAMALAARALGYGGAADLIEEEKLTAPQVSRMLLSGAARDRGRCLAVIVLTAATWRHHANPTGWNGETEKALAVAAFTAQSPFPGSSPRPVGTPPRRR